MEQFILNVLSGYGLAGLVILALGWTVLQQQKIIGRLNESRLKDLQLVLTALNNNTEATKDNAEAIDRRNEVTEELARSFERQSLVFELLTAKLEMHDKTNMDLQSDFKLTINSIAEATRVNSGILREIRDRDNHNEPVPRRRG